MNSVGCVGWIQTRHFIATAHCNLTAQRTYGLALAMTPPITLPLKIGPTNTKHTPPTAMQHKKQLIILILRQRSGPKISESMSKGWKRLW